MSLDTLQELILAARAEGDSDTADWLAGLADDPDAVAEVTGGDARQESEVAPDEVGRWLLEHGFTGTVTDAAGRKQTYVDGQHVARSKSAGAGSGEGAGKPAGGRFAQAKAAIEEKLKGSRGGRAVLAMGKVGVKIFHAIEHRLMYAAVKVQEVAAQAAKERGLSDEAAAKLKHALHVADFLGGYATGGAALAATGSAYAAKVAAIMPSASVAYLAYSTARSPLATLRAAKKVVASTFTRKGRESHESEEDTLHVGPELAAMIADRLDASDVDSDWWLACFHVALAHTLGDAERAVQLADDAVKAEPHGPADDDGHDVQEAEDSSGHEHKGKGAGGGQFTSKGGGGSAGGKKTEKKPQPTSKKGPTSAKIDSATVQEVGDESTPTLADQKEWETARSKARKIISAAPVPNKTKVKKVRAKLNAWKRAAKKARKNGDRVPKLREYYDARGGGAAHKKRAQRLFKAHGGEENGYVVCHGTGIKMHWTDDPQLNPEGLPKFEQGKIFVAFQGGGYEDDNVLPEHPSYNRLRGNKPLRKENLK